MFGEKSLEVFCLFEKLGYFSLYKASTSLLHGLFLVLFRAQCNCVPLPFLETASLLLVVASSDLVSGRKKSMLDVKDTALHCVRHVLPL